MALMVFVRCCIENYCPNFESKFHIKQNTTITKTVKTIDRHFTPVSVDVLSQPFLMQSMLRNGTILIYTYCQT